MTAKDDVDRTCLDPRRSPPSSVMRLTAKVLLYGLLGGVLVAGLKLIEYRFLVVEYSLDIYGGIVAVLFSALGVWLGLRLTKTKETVVVREVQVRVPVEVQIEVRVPVPMQGSDAFIVDSAQVERFGITPRELEILGLIADGMSNREIAASLYVSENTVKTHSSRVFDKLNAKRRTQAVQIAKAAGIIA